MIKIKYILIFMLMLAVMPVSAQKRDKSLTVSVTTNTGESVAGLQFTLYHTQYKLTYGASDVTLGTDGTKTLKVYAGNHRLTVAKDGYETVTEEFNVTKDTTVSVQLKESSQLPFSLKVKTAHDVFTGKNDVTLSWNKEAPVFFDDFESYTPFALNFGEWTGIDGDGEAAAPLVGDYANRGVRQYAQIINPMKVEPTWWYDYPILRPYSGQQYVGFTRTYSGAANDDWLISPAITAGNQNWLSFMAKAADQYKEKFQVYVTEKTDNPTADDFKLISAGNYETVDYKGWKEFKYDLSAYAGKSIKFAVHYISEANSGGAFMLMIDDVYVGQILDSSSASAKTNTLRRVISRSLQNPNESFKLYLNDVEQATTTDYDYTFKDLAAGTYKLGVKAVYRKSETAIVDTTITISGDHLAKLVFSVTTNNSKSADGLNVQIVNRETSDAYSVAVAGGKAEFPSLPYGKYIVGVTSENYDAYDANIDVTADATQAIALTEKIVKPYNVTADTEKDAAGKMNVALKWNQNLAFNDSFETYPDFAQNTFGDWKSIDLDQHTVYPIGLGSATNIVTFPGASTTAKPTAIAPIIFNPLTTTPAMYPTDAAVKAPTGDKTVAFFSPQSNGANKWLISPLLDVRDGYKLHVSAKAYAQYTETMEFCVSTTDADPKSFSVLSKVDAAPSGVWTMYETDLSAYANKKVYLAVHYTTYDGFFTQIDDFYVGNPDGDKTSPNVGYVEKYEISLDGTKVGESVEPKYTLTDVSAGSHTAGIKAVYASGASEITEYTFNVVDGIEHLTTGGIVSGPTHYYNLSGQEVKSTNLPKGVYVIKSGNTTRKAVNK